LIPPDLHKSSVIRYRLDKIIFTERRSKEEKKREKAKEITGRQQEKKQYMNHARRKNL
jgi:hypothetical protein